MEENSWVTLKQSYTTPFEAQLFITRTMFYHNINILE